MEHASKFEEGMEKILQDNPEAREVFDFVSSVMEDEGDMEVGVIEIDGKNYLAVKEFQVGENTYVHLMNEEKPADMMYQKVIVEDGEEYLVGLDSDREFDLVVAYEQKYIWQDIKKKMDASSKDADSGIE
ncbi:hypothetical protein [Hominifimenecus sp. rT4P-3]|uniref:hypothetical protein n=1 Tax=Hominifimenecus sp. rT4P-3 TaxID=3242979 RepID=UPI003DA4DD1F